MLSIAHSSRSATGNRTAKAVRIVALLDAHADGPADFVTIKAMPEAGWAHIAELTGGRPISQATRETVLSIIEMRGILPQVNFYAGVGAA